MKSAIVGISVGIVAILMGQASLLSNSASAQAYGESVYGGAIYNDSRPYSPDRGGDVDKGGSQSEAPNPSSNAPGSIPTGDRLADEMDKQLADSGDKVQTDDSDLTPGSRDERGAPKTETSSDEGSDSPNFLMWISLGTLVAACLIIWAIITRRRRERL